MKPKLIEPSSFFFNDLLSLNDRSEGHYWKKELKLEKIDEITEFSENSIIDTVPIEETPKSKFSEEKVIIYSHRSSFLIYFLQTLCRHPKIYNYFVCEGIENQILIPSRKRKGASKSKLNMTAPISLKDTLKVKSENSISVDNESSVISQEISFPISKSSRKAVIYKRPIFTYGSKAYSELSETSSIRSYSTNKNSRMNLLRRRVTLKSADPKLKNLFNLITENHSRMTSDNFSNYLAQRYPKHICDVLINSFDFKSWNFHEFVTEMNKFITQGEEKHLRLCFKLFDFDKDEKISYKDTFTAMRLRKENIYDSDLVILMQTFELKKQGRLKNLKGKMLRRKSTFSLMKEIGEQGAKPITKIKESLVPIDPAINLKEFFMVKFHGRPQILLDIFLYVAGYNFMLEKGFIERSPIHSSKNSENIVVEMNLSPEFNDIIRKSDKYDYLCHLDSSMRLYKKSQLDDLLKKFKFLQSKEKFKIRIITKQSMIENFVIYIQPKLLGYNNEYLSTRFYEYLSQSKDLSKAVFLSKMYPLVANPSQLVINRLSFDLYDFRCDGRLKVDEINRMYESLPESSPAYNECSIMVNMFIDSIFDRVREKLRFIDFPRFVEIVKISILGKDIVNLFMTPFDECLDRISLAFEVKNDT
ncbi:hypothetical protein SteCoe_18377 [Stentor coeruleus]|uniref:EF-hand domain-containing protein n=1 Tax=Stentor coeruleus TaxID=5963 RepID=A0A1R2BWW5_9CILI|nr:hypothetical protein SteCoe_18377 [Stentor coeruleus]